MRKSLAILLLPAAIYAASIFDAPELHVAPSPATPAQIHLPAGMRVLDFDVSPVGPRVALLAAEPSGARQVLFWDIGRPKPEKIWDLPAAFTARSIAWHPQGGTLFLAGQQGAEYVIVRLSSSRGVWSSQKVYASSLEIRRLVAGPRPFIRSWTEHDEPAYRLFFGLRSVTGSYSIHSIAEDGLREYQVVGHRDSFTRFPEAGENPSELVAASALPVGFHPAGHLLIWEDAANCFHVAGYNRDHWQTNTRLFDCDVCGGTVSATPNGAGILHWRTGVDGVELLPLHGAASKQAAGFQSASAPSSVADGRGIVGITRTAVGLDLNYIPIAVPLADVANAWMFTESAQDTQLLARHGGLFRDLAKDDQLYQLYDSEAYYCGNPDESTPTRPYLVTTDSFWELFAAAYEGIFIVRERQLAMPAFAEFVTQAAAALRQASPQSPWTAVFDVLAALESKPESNPEAIRIQQSDGPRTSSVTGRMFDYGELKPRGHYTVTPEAQRYFRAFRYLTRIQDPQWSTEDLRQLPAPVRSAALRWVAAYQDTLAFVALASRSGREPTTAQKLRCCSRSPGVSTTRRLFGVTYHSELPPAEQIAGPSGPRLSPSALDVAAALGSGFARGLLPAEIAKYPPLSGALDRLAVRYQPAGGAANLYQQWIEGWPYNGRLHGVSQWRVDAALWRAKRLQTGLASWATLRHATVLVNERVPPNAARVRSSSSSCGPPARLRGARPADLWPHRRPVRCGREAGVGPGRGIGWLAPRGRGREARGPCNRDSSVVSRKPRPRPACSRPSRRRRLAASLSPRPITRRFCTSAASPSIIS